MNFAADQTLALGLTVKQLVAVLLPLIGIQAGLVIAALLKLRKTQPEHLRGSKRFWITILILCLVEYPLGLLGPILFFTIGRNPNERH